MRILFFVDTHGNERYHKEIKQKAMDVDLVVCAGDFTIFERSMQSILNFFDTFGKPFIVIHSNHETSTGLMTACEPLHNVKFVHNTYFIKGDLIFFCYGGGGFSTTDNKFDIVAEDFMKTKNKVYPKHKLIFLTHQPPHDTALDDLGGPVGNINFRKFIEKYHPLYAISGHIHETAGAEDNIGQTILFNPGPVGRIIIV